MVEPFIYEVHDMDQLLDLIKQEEVNITGGWSCRAGWVVTTVPKRFVTAKPEVNVELNGED